MQSRYSLDSSESLYRSKHDLQKDNTMYRRYLLASESTCIPRYVQCISQRADTASPGDRAILTAITRVLYREHDSTGYLRSNSSNSKAKTSKRRERNKGLVTFQS
ncbi:uncharacterized protein LOC143303116 [Bombus vancouverensis nearcticus]|uniref:uncharacterized protein LOC143303116 n=1 Tax=Bombus vancouverensis nearcticus TaxID=2705178 RepID=UPI00402BC63D